MSKTPAPSRSARTNRRELPNDILAKQLEHGKARDVRSAMPSVFESPTRRLLGDSVNRGNSPLNFL